MKHIPILILLLFLLTVGAGVAEEGKVYLVAEVKILDAEVYSRYVERVPRVVEKYGGRYVIRSEEAKPMTGGWSPDKLVVIEFDSMDKLKECFNSPDYLAILTLRESSSRSRAVIVEGHE